MQIKCTDLEINKYINVENSHEQVDTLGRVGWQVQQAE